MLSVVLSYGLTGIEGFPVRVEVNLSRGITQFELVGLPDGRLTVNLAPADQKKEGPAFDLPMAVGILAASGGIMPEALEDTALLGELVHPFVTAVLFRQLKQAQGLVVYDAPQLFEANGDAICDCVIAVVADEAVRRERIISRDGLSPEQADARIKAQHSEAFFRQNADHIIENNADEATLRQTAARVLCAVKQEVR